MHTCSKKWQYQNLSSIRTIAAHTKIHIFLGLKSKSKLNRLWQKIPFECGFAGILIKYRYLLFWGLHGFCFYPPPKKKENNRYCRYFKDYRFRENFPKKFLFFAFCARRLRGFLNLVKKHHTTRELSHTYVMSQYAWKMKTQNLNEWILKHRLIYESVVMKQATPPTKKNIIPEIFYCSTNHEKWYPELKLKWIWSLAEP